MSLKVRQPLFDFRLIFCRLATFEALNGTRYRERPWPGLRATFGVGQFALDLCCGNQREPQVKMDLERRQQSLI